MSRRALPYRVPPEDVVTAEPWRWVVENDEVEMPDRLPDWDYQLDLHLRRKVTVDLDRARSGAGLPADAALALAVVWTATGSNLSGPAEHARLDDQGVVTADFDIVLRGSDLGGLLALDTALVLAERRLDGGPASPRRAGSVLWSDRAELRLQGDAPQFPIAIIDFALTSFPEDAAWHLQIDGGLDSATMGSLLLLVNSRNTVTAEAFEHAGKPRPVDRVVLSTVYAEVARIMVEHALSQDDFSEDGDYPEGSLGATFVNLLDRLFPGRPVADLRLRRDQSPAHFASDLQAAVKLFGGL